ncbi:MAG: endopeptidase La, partial [Planctomycetes bacterium]|nr:endopeptidase La [Planctomycetota bacterium]
ATPKEGPSAGVAMCTSIISVLTGIAVRSSVAMTGEITLRGRALPIDGLKEKLLAALRGGITTVIIPKENERNLSEIPNDVRRGIEIITAATVDEALQYALVEQPEPIDWPEKAAVEAISSGSAVKEIKGVVTH